MTVCGAKVFPSEPKRSPRGWESAAPINSVNSEGSVMGARKVISSLVDRDNLPNAVETFNDVTAIGAMNDFASAGKSIPGDSAVMGGRHRPELAADSGANRALTWTLWGTVHAFHGGSLARASKSRTAVKRKTIQET